MPPMVFERLENASLCTDIFMILHAGSEGQYCVQMHAVSEFAVPVLSAKLLHSTDPAIVSFAQRDGLEKR